MEISLKSILAEGFAKADLPEIESLLKQNKIYDSLNLSLIYINDFVKDFKETEASKTPQVEYIWSGLIVRIDECLKMSAHLNDETITNFLAANCNYIFTRSVELTIEAVPDKTKVLLLNAFKSTITDTVNIFSPESSVIKNCLVLISYADEQFGRLETENSPADNTKIPGLHWKIKGLKTEEILFRFLKYNICEESEMNKIKALFSHPTANLNIVLNVSKKENVLLFFYYLNYSGTINYSNCRSVYMALSYHVPNFKYEFMNNEEAYRINFRCARNLAGQRYLDQLEADFRNLIRT